LGLCTSEDDGELYDVEKALERVAENKDDNNHNQDPGNVQISSLPSKRSINNKLLIFLGFVGQK
jgi:hypothetical protein